MNVSHSDDWQHGRVYDVTTARAPSMARKPRMQAVALSDTLVTRADGSTYVIPRRKPTTTTRKAKPKVRTYTTRELIDMAAYDKLGTIHASNDI